MTGNKEFNEFVMHDMKNGIRQIISFILPFTVLVVVPLLIEKDIRIKSLPAFIIGVYVMCIGLMIMILTITAFIRKGNGTLAPWNPTKKLVKGGLYSYVRNPMIMGVMTVLSGESIALLSKSIFIWTLLFFLINNFYFVWIEEPTLAKKFGKDYLEYKRHVRRWIPRFRSFKKE